MKRVFGNQRYLLFIGLIIVLAFTLIAFFISGKLNERVDDISGSLAKNVYKQKAVIMKAEFDNLLRTITTGENLLKEIKNSRDIEELSPAIRTILLADPKVNHAWYAVVKNSDTVYTAINRANKGYVYTSVPLFIKKWVRSDFKASDTLVRINRVISHADSLHLLNASRINLPDKTEVLFGFDINLRELRQYFWNVDKLGQAYFFIIDKNGFCLSHPDEKLIGKKLYPMQDSSMIKKVLTDGVVRHEIVRSNYLDIPVMQYYSPFIVGTEHWILGVSTPLTVFSEDVAAIRNYTLVMGVLSVFIILTLVLFAQLKWQKEFTLRQEVQEQSDKLALKTQQLQLKAERQEKENALLQLQKLKEKVDPHFLFNSFGSLNALIEQNPELAREFVVKLSRVYRYVLDSNTEGLSSVNEELRFASQYYFLLQIRFGEALPPLNVNIKEEHMQKQLPFMSLQTVIENAIKHNIVSKTDPLHIKIESEDNHLVISNNYQLRNDVNDSGKQGLTYVKSTYSHYGNSAFRHGRESDEYKCYLPLL